jgi:exodeoxyribonuclease-5
MDVCYIAFTGKAATVLQQKGCPGATTAHKLLFKAKPMPNGTYKFVERESFDRAYKIIVVDEVSMLPNSMWEILLKHGVYVLACGDPGQLPPINPEETNTVLNEPHVFLDEIMRQAQESEIIRLSMHIREGKPLSAFQCAGTQVQMFDKTQLSTGMMTWADQILCGTNKKRNEINDVIRMMKGFGPEPAIGDKIISLRNHWDDVSDFGGWALTNGAIGTIKDYSKTDIILPRYISTSKLTKMNTTMELEDGDRFTSIPIDYKCLTTGEPALKPEQEYKMKKDKKCPDPLYPFAYAYAITTHKAQGSEWNNVLVVEEAFPFPREDHKRWLYTACTRASEKLVVIKK